MVYVPVGTASGHRLMVDPKRNRATFRSLIEAQLAESRFVLNERTVSYQKYRSKRGCAGTFTRQVTITHTAKNQVDKLDDLAFAQVDSGIIGLAEQPTPPGSKPKHYRWFLGGLRRVTFSKFPVIYTVAEDGGEVRILFIGLQNWANPKRAHETANGNGKANSEISRQSRKLKWVDRFISYSGEKPDELLDYPPDGQYDSIVEAFREGIQRKAANKGVRALTPEEQVVLAITALQQEVNNGGYDQFFRNDSRQFSAVIVGALERIACRREARITQEALDVIKVRKLSVKAIDNAMTNDNFERDQKLDRCDQRFYKAQTGMAKRLYRFIKRNRTRIVLSENSLQLT